MDKGIITSTSFKINTCHQQSIAMMLLDWNINEIFVKTTIHAEYSGKMNLLLCSSLPSMAPDRSRSYWSNIWRHWPMYVHSAWNSCSSMLPDRSRSNIPVITHRKNLSCLVMSWRQKHPRQPQINNTKFYVPHNNHFHSSKSWSNKPVKIC